MIVCVGFAADPSIFADGFDSGNFASWSGTSGSPTVVSSPVHHGNYAMLCDASGEGVYKTGISGYSTVYTRFYVRINTLPARGQSVKIAKAMTSGLIALWELYFQRTPEGESQIRLKASVPSSSDLTFAYSYAVNTWYCLEVKYTQSTAGEYRVWLNGTQILSRTGVNTSSRGFGRLDVGSQWSNYAVKTNIDCLGIGQNYIGPEATVVDPVDRIVPSAMTVGVIAGSAIMNTINLVQDCGIQLVKLEFSRSTLSYLRTLVPKVVGKGIKVVGLLLRIDLAPYNVDAWGTWVSSVVKEFKGYVHVWDVWNEPNLNKYFPGKDPVKYTAFLKRAYTEAKHADPTCFVLGGGVAFTHSTAQSFLKTMYQNGANSYMDALSWHPYCDPYAPTDTSSTPNPFTYLSRIRDIMIQYGAGNKKIWITEVGWSSSLCGLTNQANYITQALKIAENWGWVEAFIIFNWKDSASTGTGTKGLLNTRESPKPSFYAVKTFIKG